MQQLLLLVLKIQLEISPKLPYQQDHQMKVVDTPLFVSCALYYYTKYKIQKIAFEG